MKIRKFRTAGFIASAAILGIVVASAQTPPEPGATPGVVLTNISKNTPKFASVFPQVAVSRSNANLVAVAWRQYNLPIDTNAQKGDSRAVPPKCAFANGTSASPMIDLTRIFK